MDEPILVWRFHSAPKELQVLSPHGGDEDWLALVPPAYAEDYTCWMDSGSAFGCCDVSECEHPTKPGYKVRIGAHS